MAAPPIMDSSWDILSLDGFSLSKKMESGEVTSLELMEATVTRIHQLNPSYRALINVLPDKVLLETARQYDNIPRRGWLHGIPFAVKDLSDVAGFPTSLGGSPLVDYDAVAAGSDDYCQRLIDAGVIVIGKTNTPEHGLGSHTYNAMWGTTINPYSASCRSHQSPQTLSAGGSSGGAAVAVATRMLCLADGSDMMGSLRNPAGWNNIYSLRPTAGMIGTDDGNATGVACNPLPFPISTVGPMARTPRDLGLLLETMSPSGSFSASSVNGISCNGMTIGWLADWDGAYSTEPGIKALCRQSLKQFEAAGATIRDVDVALYDANTLWDSWTTIRSKVVSATAIADYGEDALLGPDAAAKKELVWEVKRGLTLSDSEIEEAVIIANDWFDSAQEACSKYDALALPSAQVWPFDASLDWPKSICSVEMDTYHRWMEVVVPATLAGLPCVTIPAGFGDSGLPMGIQLVGARGSDARLLALAESYHELIDWPSKQPPYANSVISS